MLHHTGFRTSCIRRNLEQLGLMAAVRGFCKEFAVAHEIAIEFTDRSVPRDMALCLYRIVQEALHNVVKHSGGTAARAELAMEGGRASARHRR